MRSIVCVLSSGQTEFKSPTGGHGNDQGVIDGPQTEQVDSVENELVREFIQ